MGVGKMQELETKKVTNTKKMMMAVAITAFMISHAFAATPKTESVVTAEHVTLGDVFEGVTENADYSLAPAPAAGKAMTLNAGDLLRISEAFNLGWMPTDGKQKLVIRRSTAMIDSYDIQAALQEKMTEAMKGQRFEMELTDRAVSFRVTDTKNKGVNVEKLSYDAVKGEFKALVAAASSPDEKKEVKGRFYQVNAVPVLKAPLRQGDVISVNDIDYIDMHSNAVSSNTIIDEAKLIGQTPRRGIAAMKPITVGDVQMPVVIKKGDLVTMTLKNNAINLTAQGRAMDDGAAGEPIRVMNTTSKQVIGAVVTGPQMVSITFTANAL